jgi:hypothetical protein
MMAMTPDLATVVPKRKAFDWSSRIEIANAFKLDSRLSLSLPAIVAGLAGAAAIVYIATRHRHPATLPTAAEPEAIETTGVSLVK